MDNVINLSASDFNNKITNDKSAIVIDVRTPQEYDDGHISNSLLIDIYSPTFADQISKLDKAKNYYIYCRRGHRSFNAGVFMIEQGFNKVHHLKEGIISWTEKLEK